MTDLHNCKKIGILGGTFNPIHMGHLLMAEYAKEACDLDVVFMMPSGVSYLKAGTGVLPGQVRLKLVELSVSDNPYLLPSEMEVLREGNTYTYETLEELKKRYPCAQLFFIVGADSLLSMENWVEPARIFANCTILAACRGETSRAQLEEKKNTLRARLGARIILFDFPQVDISSTEIRERVCGQKSIRYMVTESVRKYIEENNLYRD